MERVGLMMLMVWLNLLLLPMNCVNANEEVDALIAVKMKLRDPNKSLRDWDPTNSTPCTWFRIYCDAEESVTRMHLGNMSLLGELAPELGRLKKLEFLDLSHNGLGGQIPPQLGDLTNLKMLVLSHNNLVGTPPAELGKLLNLTHLVLNDNQLSGCIPLNAWIAMISHLEYSTYQITRTCTPRPLIYDAKKEFDVPLV